MAGQCSPASKADVRGTSTCVSRDGLSEEVTFTPTAAELLAAQGGRDRRLKQQVPSRWAEQRVRGELGEREVCDGWGQSR